MPIVDPLEEKLLFDPHGTGYDMETAGRRGIKPDDTGHFPSVAPLSRDEAATLGLPPDSGIILKGRRHQTFHKTEEAERSLGRKIVEKKGRLYSVPQGLDEERIFDPLESRIKPEHFAKPPDTGETPGLAETRERSNFAQRNAIAFQLGIAPDEVDVTTGADFLDRFDFSFSDNDAEIVKKFRTQNPQGAIHRINLPEKFEKIDEQRKVQQFPGGSRLVFKINKGDPQEKWKTIEDYGRTSLADIADIAGPTATTLPGVALSLLSGPGAIPQALAFGLGTAAGHAGKEGIEEMRGFQEQPLGEVAMETGLAGLGAAAPAFGLGLGRNVANVGMGRGLLKVTPEDRLAAERIRESGLPLRPLTVPQLAPDRPVIQRFARQASATSPVQREVAREQLMSAEQALSGLETRGAAKTGRPLQRMTQKLYRDKYFGLLKEKGFVSPEKGGKALKGAGEDFVSGSRAVVRNLYTNADNAAVAERPVFDLGPALREVDEIERGIRALTYGADEAAVEVSGVPRNALLSVIGDLRQIAQTQVDYEAVKQLRTRLFDLIDNHPWNYDFNKFQARRLYSTLTNVLEQPVNPTPGFVQAFRAANQAAKDRFSILEESALQRIIKSDQPALLAQHFGAPGQLTENVFQAIKRHSPQKLRQFQEASQLQMLRSPGGAMNRIEDFARLDPEGFVRLVPKGERKLLLDYARKVDALEGSRTATVLNAQTRASQFVEKLIKDQDPQGVEQVIGSAGGFGSEGHKMLRAGAIQHVIERSRSLTKGERGFRFIETKKLSGVIEEYKKSGVWEKVLTREDRLKLNALEDYMRLLRIGDDVGTSIESAGLVAGLKHPRTFLQALHGLSANALMARFLVSRPANYLLVGRGQAQNFSTLRRFGTVVSAIHDDIEAGEQGPLGPAE